MENFYKNFDWIQCDRLIKMALSEDVGSGDVTSDLLIPEKQISRAVLLLKEDAIIAGLQVFQRVFGIIDRKIQIIFRSRDGFLYQKGKKLAYLEGSTSEILRGERVALNILQRMCGIANNTFNMVQKLKNKSVKIIDTRKTTPNFRIFEKLAVKMGGGENHRMGLYDMILIKDNHINANGGIKNTLLNLRRKLSDKNIKTEIEVRNLKEFEIVKRFGRKLIDVVMLDNFSVDKIEKTIKLNENEFQIEISGGIDNKNIKKFSNFKNGPDYISSGSLTHSYQSTDIALNFIT